MSDTVKYLSKITLLDGTQVKIKDSEARAAIAGGTHFIGITTTALTDGSGTNPVVINGDDVTAANGDIVVYGNKEFIWADVDSKWHELGDVTNLGALALKDSASGSYTPEGTVTFSGGTVSSSGSYTPAGEVTFSGGTVSSSGSYTPAGTVEFSGGTVESTGSYTPAGTVEFSGGTVESSGSYTPAGEVTFSGGTVSSSGSYTPAGTVSKPAVDVTAPTASISVFDQAGSVTAGSAASFAATYDESTENLTLSFTANTPTAVTLPTSKVENVVSSVSAELHEAPSFSGTAATIEVEGTAAGTATFSGTAATIEVEGTAAGTATFSGTAATIEVEGTAAGTATFSGTAATIEVEGTAAGTATFSGTAATIEVEGTAAGTATFSGTTATITVS